MLKLPLWRFLPLVLASAAHAAHITAPAKSTAGPRPEVVGFWRFEHDVKPESHSTAAGPVKRLGTAEYFFQEDVPGPWIYDPLQKFSYPNTASLSFESDEKRNDALQIALNTAKAGLAGQSVTLELFFKPNAEWDGPLAMKARLNDTAAEWGLETRYFEQQRQTYLQAFFTPPGGQTEHFRGGHYGTSAQVLPQSTAWRHMAFVYDAAAKTLACYIDYYQVKTLPIPGEMKWDAGALYIGGGPLRSSFGGLIDEVRLTKGALRPGQFLHARKDPIAGVSLESAETLLPRDCGYIDLKECFGALGDGRTDDTAAFKEAFRVLSGQAPLAHNTLYIPPGTYLINDTLQSGRSLTVQGAGMDKTVLKLRDKCPGFTRAAEPHPFWQIDNAPVLPGVNGPVVESSPGAAIYDLTIDTGKANAGAKGLEIHARHLRRLENLQIRSGDGAGIAGLDLTSETNGTALARNIRIKGFDHGVVCNALESTTTFEQLGLEGQREAGIKNVGGILAIRLLNSVNKVPALASFGAGSMVTLLDSSLKGGGKDLAAIKCEGALYALRVETAGYKSAIHKRILVNDKTQEWKEETIPGPKIAEYIADQVVTGHGALTSALKLPVQNAPDVPWGDIRKDWVNVDKFSARKAGEDWAPAIQAAIDSGARTVYFPPARYEVLSSIHVHGKIDRLFGLHSQIVRGPGLAPEIPAVIFDEPDAKRVLSVERLEIDGWQNTSPSTLALKSSNLGRYTNAEGCGKLFIEDVAGSEFQFSQAQNVWARQWNCVGHPIVAHGTTIWCLGLSAGGKGGALVADKAAHIEILGGFVQPTPVPNESFVFRARDSRLALIYGALTGDTAAGPQIVDTEGSDTKEIGMANLRQTGRRARMDLYLSDGTGEPVGK